MSTARQGKKIVHVVQHLAPGGLESLALELMNFAQPDDQVLIISLEGTKTASLQHWPKLRAYDNQLVFLNKKSGVQLSLMVTLIHLFKVIKPDVVHTHHIGPLLYAGIAARVAAVATRIHTEHDAWHLENKKHQRLQGIALKAAKPTLVADAPHVKEKLNRYFSSTDSIVIKNGIDCDKFRPGSKTLAREQYNLPQHKQIIGSAGRLEPVKGHDVLIKAMAFLPQNTVLAIAGAGSQRNKLEALAEKLNLQQRVIFVGLVNDMPGFYQALDLFCLPSRFEGLPLSPLEAQACNIPAVVTDVGAASEVLCPHTGALVKANDVIELCHTLFKQLNKPPACSAREFVVTNNNIRHMVQAYDALSMERSA